MVHAHRWPHQRHNRLLAALPEDGYAALAPHLEPVTLAFKDSVYAPNRPIPHVLFPTTGVFSVLTVMADGAAIEVATVGNEGIWGLSGPDDAWPACLDVAIVVTAEGEEALAAARARRSAACGAARRFRPAGSPRRSLGSRR